MVTTNDGVTIEVLDYGGKGPDLIFLAGLGSSGHVFDDFSRRFIRDYHVWSITRRGFGGSSRPDPAYASYTADRLGDDVLTVMDQMHIPRAVLAGWSMGGEEISSVATRRPERVAAAVYLDAAYAYAWYAPGNMDPPPSNLFAIVNTMHQKISDAVRPGAVLAETSAKLEDVLNNDLPQLHDHLVAMLALEKSQPPSPPLPPLPPDMLAKINVGQAIMAGEQEYGSLTMPVLAIYAFPHALPPNATPQMILNHDRADQASDGVIRRYQAGNPKARVVRIANAQHAIFRSNPEDVEKEMRAFLASLPQPGH
jgi:pimeloyl-ACP methyl ester carboxylesterase